jgi:hypothetical protein
MGGVDGGASPVDARHPATSPAAPSLASLLETLATSREHGTSVPALQAAFELTAFPAQQPLAEELTPDQRRVAEALALRSELPLSGSRVPFSVQFRRGWLGLDPPRTLDRTHAVVHEGREHVWPLWKAWQVLGDDPIGKRGISALGLSTVELLDAYVDVLLWSVYAAGKVDPSVIYDHLDTLGADGGDWAKQRLDEMAAWPAPVVEMRDGIRWVKSEAEAFGFSTFEPSCQCGHGQLALLLAIARAGRTIEPSWEKLVPFTPNSLLVEVAAALPDDRREAVLLAAADAAVTTDALRTCFVLWPLFPLMGLFQLAERLLADRTTASGFPQGTLPKWRARWKGLLTTTPLPNAPAAGGGREPRKRRGRGSKRRGARAALSIRCQRSRPCRPRALPRGRRSSARTSCAGGSCPWRSPARGGSRLLRRSLAHRSLRRT